MNPTQIPSTPDRAQLNVFNDDQYRFHEIGMHRLWRRPVHVNENLKSIPFWTQWPWQIALDKIEHAISQNLYRFTVDRVLKVNAGHLIQLEQYMTNWSLGATIFRTEYDMIHLTKFQKERRIALLSWMKQNCDDRFNVCQEQIRSLDFHQSIVTPKYSPQPKWIVGSIAGDYLERLREWIEHIYDQKKRPESGPQLPEQLTSNQSCDISVGIKLILSQLAARTSELAAQRYISRLNLGRSFVKASILCPIISILARKILRVHTPGLTLAAVGFSGAVAMWVVSHFLFIKEVSNTSLLNVCLCELLDESVKRHRLLRVEEWERFYARQKASQSTPDNQKAASASSEEASKSRLNLENSSALKDLKEQLRVKEEKLDELRIAAEEYQKEHRELEEAKRLFEEARRDNEWLKAYA